MDCRVTFGKREALLGIINDCIREGRHASLLYDEGGLTRAEGTIESVRDEGESSFLTLDNGQRIEIKAIVAINGVFSESYSVC